MNEAGAAGDAPGDGGTDSGRSGSDGGSGRASVGDGGEGADFGAGGAGDGSGGSATGGSAGGGTAGSAGASDVPEHCGDEIDNDGDGDTDCADSDCEEPCARTCESTGDLDDPAEIETTNAGHEPAPPNQCETDGPALVYELNVATTGMLEVEVDGSGLYMASISSACADTRALACGPGHASAPVSAGDRVFVRVAGIDPQDQGTFTLSVHSRALNVCGDGYRDEAEACDDDNERDGDGCDASCSVEASELEPNGDIDTGTPFEAPHYAEISPAGDEDFAMFELDARLSVLVETRGIGDRSCMLGAQDSAIDLYDADGDLLFSDDDDGEGNCARLAMSLGAGRYFVRVTASSTGNTATFPYELNVRSDECGNDNVAAGEECDDGNLENGDGCDDLCREE